MNKNLMKKMGFEEEVKRFEKGICPFCQIKIKDQKFRNEKSIKEYKISGLCQNCQDETFVID